MKVYRYGVFTIERETRSWEEYNADSGRFERMYETVKQPRMTYCDSREEAKEFLREIGLRGHPNVLYAKDRGLIRYVG